ncbi:Release factor glutamine methyltransferase [Bienertia sinuspersici]
MGKNGKKQRHQQKPSSRQRHSHFPQEDEDFNFNGSSDQNPPSLSLSNSEDEDENQQEQKQECDPQNHNLLCDDSIPSKFSLYQQSVQSPKGDISYLQKFFLMYVGGRAPLHLQEDFCGTALLSTEWLRTNPRRTAIGVDLDLEALKWCMENNVNKVGSDISSMIYLFHGNVLQPLEASLVKSNHPENLMQNVTIQENEDVALKIPAENSLGSAASVSGGNLKKDFSLPGRDIVCAFNYSCCCLHKRKELVEYFKHALDALSKKGGIFVMDLYGGTSSEHELKLSRKFPNFTYTWEQAEFDVIQRMTRISLHYQLNKPQKKIRNAFSYSWRLWSLPEIRDCLEEAGYRAIHFWIREMPDTERNRSTRGFNTSRDDKYEEVTSFQQQDAWNAYVVAVA